MTSPRAIVAVFLCSLLVLVTAGCLSNREDPPPPEKPRTQSPASTLPRTTIPGPLPAPALISPANGAVLDNGRTDRDDNIIWNFAWSAVPGANLYELYVKKSDAATPIIDGRIGITSWSVANFVDIGHITEENRFGWTWKVRASDRNGQWSEWSEVRTFDVEPPNTDPSLVVNKPPPTIVAGQLPIAPTLISPANGAVLDNGRTDRNDSIIWDFDWSDIPGATRYHLWVIGSHAIIPVINRKTTTSSFHSERQGSYIIGVNCFGWTWKVSAEVGGQWSDWSEVRTFDVEPMNTDPPQTQPLSTSMLADLTITTGSPTVTPSTVNAGGQVTLSAWKVENLGNVASGSFLNGFYLSTDPIISAGDTYLTGNGNSTLAPGSCFNWGGPTLTIPPKMPPGTYYIGILVDRTNTVPESNENNNYVASQITVSAGALSPTPTMTPDQSNTTTKGTSYGDGQNLFQSFTPTTSELKAVELSLRAGGSFPEAGVNTQVNIRSGAWNGPVLGTATVFVAGPEMAENQSMVLFQFFPSIVLTPGQLYIIEWVGLPPSVFMWMGSDANPYAGGTAIGSDGGPMPNVDYFFITYN